MPQTSRGLRGATSPRIEAPAERRKEPPVAIQPEASCVRALRIAIPVSLVLWGLVAGLVMLVLAVT